MLRWEQPAFSSKEVLAAISMMLLAVVLMATARHGIRVVSFEEPLRVQAEATKSYMDAALAEYRIYKQALKDQPKADLNDPAVLAETRGCTACHDPDVKLVGPAFKEIANRYSSTDDVIGSIMNGSEGKWDVVPMPAQNIDEAEARKLARWILEHK